MEFVKLEAKAQDGSLMQASFCPEKGMNLVSYKHGNIEIMDQTTNVLFEQRGAGLGALIGPHFHHRNPKVIPPIKDEYLFPHFQMLRDQGIKEPFSHGIGRYVPWKVDLATKTKIKAVLSSKNQWKGITLGYLEGQEFSLIYTAEMLPTGLQIDYSCVSDSNSMVGLHYYYSIGKGHASVESEVIPKYNDQGTVKNIPDSFGYGADKKIHFDLKNEADFGFWPSPSPLMGDVRLKTEQYDVHIRYTSATAENSWQLYHPKGSSFVCIEPMSAKDPRKPQLSVSGIRVSIAVEPAKIPASK